MYKLILISILVFSASLQIEAQNVPNSNFNNRERAAFRSEQIQTERIAYFTEKIGLTSEEAQAFWPIYNEMDNRRTAMFEEKAAIIQVFMNSANSLNDKQINERLNRLATITQQEGALHGEYDAKFRKVLPAQKVMNLYVAEMGFRNYLLQTMRNRRDGGNRTEK